MSGGSSDGGVTCRGGRRFPEGPSSILGAYRLGAFGFGGITVIEENKGRPGVRPPAQAKYVVLETYLGSDSGDKELFGHNNLDAVFGFMTGFAAANRIEGRSPHFDSTDPAWMERYRVNHNLRLVVDLRVEGEP